MPPLALALIVFGCADADQEKAGFRDGQLRTLTGQEIRRLLTGNTVQGRDELGPFWMHYPSDGTVWGLASNGDVDIGQWWVAGNHYCRSWRRWRDGAEQCWLFASDGSSRLLWIEPDGRSFGESTLQAGNGIGRGAKRQLAAAALIGSDLGLSAPAEDVPVDAAGVVLVARPLDSGRGGEPSGIDSGAGGGRAGEEGSGASAGNGSEAGGDDGSGQGGGGEDGEAGSSGEGDDQSDGDRGSGDAGEDGADGDAGSGQGGGGEDGEGGSDGDGEGDSEGDGDD